jgi:hypothetical protein
MVDMKGRDPTTSLMTYLVDQLHVQRRDLLEWTNGLSDIVHKVSAYSVKALGAEIEGGLVCVCVCVVFVFVCVCVCVLVLCLCVCVCVCCVCVYPALSGGSRR